MSEQARERIPELTLGWRLKMALGKMHANDMADALDLSRTTISRWLNGRGKPPPAIYVKQWALITGTDVGWLLHGTPDNPRPATPSRQGTREYDSYRFALAPAA